MANKIWCAYREQGICYYPPFRGTVCPWKKQDQDLCEEFEQRDS